MFSSVTEPESVELHVDGEKDKCSQGEDINFVFTGFSINGKVRLLAIYTYWQKNIKMVYRKNDGGREQNVLLISKELEANIYTYANIEKLTDYKTLIGLL